MAAETLAEGPTPEARIGHTAIYDPNSRRIFVFGGSKNKKWFNDVHILDTQSWKWTMVEVRGDLCPHAVLALFLFLFLNDFLLLFFFRLRVRFLPWPTTAAVCFRVSCSCWEGCFLGPTQSPMAVATLCISLTPASPSGTSPSSPETNPLPAQGNTAQSKALFNAHFLSFFFLNIIAPYF